MPRQLIEGGLYSVTKTTDQQKDSKQSSEDESAVKDRGKLKGLQTDGCPWRPSWWP